MNVKFPNEGPLYSIYIQDYGDNQGVIIWKAHHAIGDGVTFLSFQLALSSDYDTSYFVGGKKDISLMQRIMLHLSIPFYVP